MLPPFEPPPGISVVYSDVDGTMLGRGGAFVLDPDGHATVEPARALIAAIEAGIDIVPCSGRAMPGIARDGRMLGMTTAIGEMGAVLSYDTGREVVTSLGQYPGGSELPVRFMERCGAVALLLERFLLEPHAPWAQQRDYTYLLRGTADPAEATEALAAAELGWLELVDNGLLHGPYLGLPPGASHAYHLLPKGVSKGSAIALDRARRGINRSECIGIGDSIADLAMGPEVELIVLTADAVADHPALAGAAEQVPNAAVTARAGNLGWADALALLSERKVSKGS